MRGIPDDAAATRKCAARHQHGEAHAARGSGYPSEQGRKARAAASTALTPSLTHPLTPTSRVRTEASSVPAPSSFARVCVCVCVSGGEVSARRRGERGAPAVAVREQHNQIKQKTSTRVRHGINSKAHRRGGGCWSGSEAPRDVRGWGIREGGSKGAVAAPDTHRRRRRGPDQLPSGDSSRHASHASTRRHLSCHQRRPRRCTTRATTQPHNTTA